tara:strand:- start:474 stop:680 length:207 start_codon:yes stop_codon:yes gene_type:complete
MYKIEYRYENDKYLHNRFYSALNLSTAKAMFEATCDEGSLSGCNVKIIDVSEISEAKFKNKEMPARLH